VVVVVGDGEVAVFEYFAREETDRSDGKREGEESLEEMVLPLELVLGGDHALFVGLFIHASAWLLVGNDLKMLPPNPIVCSLH